MTSVFGVWPTLRDRIQMLRALPILAWIAVFMDSMAVDWSRELEATATDPWAPSVQMPKKDQSLGLHESTYWRMTSSEDRPAGIEAPAAGGGGGGDGAHADDVDIDDDDDDDDDDDLARSADRYRTIILSGKRGAGKDTLAAMLPNHTRLALADPLKQICQRLIQILCDVDLPLPTWHDPKHKDAVIHGRSVNGRPFSRRAVMQEVGDVLRDSLGKDVFVDALLRKSEGKAHVVVTDARMPDEKTELIRRAPCPSILLEVQAVGAGTRLAPGSDPLTDAHATETQTRGPEPAAVIRNPVAKGKQALRDEALRVLQKETTRWRQLQAQEHTGATA